MIQQAFISGQIGKVIYTEDDRHFLLTVEHLEKPVECRPMDLSLFFNYGAEFTTLSGAQLDLAQLKAQLIARRQAYRALTLTISGLDAELDHECRRAAIETAESLLRDGPTHQFVRARMLARPLPAEADIEIARDIAIRSDATSVGLLYQHLLDSEQAISLVYETWLEAAPGYFASPEEQAESESMLLDLGVFAEIALALTRGDVTALSSIIITYGRRPEINSKSRQGALILNDLRTRLAAKWGMSKIQSGGNKRGRGAGVEPERIAEGDDPVHGILAEFRHRREHPRSRTLRADEAKEKVDHQIEAIRKHIRRGNINRAGTFLRDLINFHVEHSKREHLGMSLCALAKVAIDTSAFELAEKMVHYALMLGIDDIVISTTQAQTFKAMGRFDEALAVYQETMTRFSSNRIVRTGYASVLMLMNRFSDVRALLSETPLSSKDDWIDYHIIAMSFLKSGNIDEAIRRFAHGLENNPWLTNKNHFATALALANIKKKQYAEVLEALPTNVIGLDIFQRQTRLALIGHSQAALGRKEEAVQTLAELEQAVNPRIINLKEAIARRYELTRQDRTTLSPAEQVALETVIDDEEFFLAMAA